MGVSIGLIGPGMMVIVALTLADAAAAVYLVHNAWVRPDSDFAGVPEGRWSYIAPQALYAIIYVIAQIPFLARAMPWAHGYALAVPFVLAQQVAYLLRVVYPTHGRLEARLQAQCAALAASAPDDPEADPTIARSTTHA